MRRYSPTDMQRYSKCYKKYELCLSYDPPDDPPKYGHPVARGEDQHEPTADEDDASQLHVTEHHTVHHDVVS